MEENTGTNGESEYVLDWRGGCEQKEGEATRGSCCHENPSSAHLHSKLNVDIEQHWSISSSINEVVPVLGFKIRL